MARPTEQKPWHSAAIQLRNQGLSYAKIGEMVGVKQDAVRMFLARSTPERQVKSVVNAPKIAPMPPPPAIQATMMDLMVKVERNRAQTLDDAMGAVKYALALGDDEAVDNKGAMKKAYLAVEAIKALRTGADISITMDKLDAPMKQAQADDAIVFRIVDPREPNA